MWLSAVYARIAVRRWRKTWWSVANPTGRVDRARERCISIPLAHIQELSMVPFGELALAAEEAVAPGIRMATVVVCQVALTFTIRIAWAAASAGAGINEIILWFVHKIPRIF